VSVERTTYKYTQEMGETRYASDQLVNIYIIIYNTPCLNSTPKLYVVGTDVLECKT